MKAYSCLVSNGNNRKIPIKGGGAFFKCLGGPEQGSGLSKEFLKMELPCVLFIIILLAAAVSLLG